MDVLLYAELEQEPQNVFRANSLPSLICAFTTFFLASPGPQTTNYTGNIPSISSKDSFVQRRKQLQLLQNFADGNNITSHYK